MTKKLKILFLPAALCFSIFANAQFGVSHHITGSNMFGANYTYDQKFQAEARLGANVSLDLIFFELIAAYIFAKNEDYEAYAGVGATTGPAGFDGGGIIPVGINLYPFENKKFGIMAEASFLIVDQGLLRGSFGFRYRFRKE